MTADPIRYEPPRAKGGWARSPAVSPRALRHARAAVAPVAAFLKRSGADMVVMHFVSGAPRSRRYSATVWRRDGTGFAIDPETRLDNAAVLAEIAGALAELAREIGSRWPANAQPRSIGMAVDGDSIAFNASYPSADGSEWLDEHLRGRAPAVLLHDGGGTGLLTTLCPRK